MATPVEPALGSDLIIGSEASGLRLDVWVSRRFGGVGRRSVRELFEQRAITVNTRVPKPGQRLAAGDRVCLHRQPQGVAFNPEPNPTLGLCVVYADAWLVAVAKAPGVPCYPLRPSQRSTLVNALLARFPEMAGVGHEPRQAGLVHRVDTGTSGLVIAARTRRSFACLWRQLRAGTLDKRYTALCQGRLRAPARLEHWLDTAHRRSVRAYPSRDAFGAVRQRAVCHVLRAQPLADLTLAEVRAVRAVRHQLRVQLAAAGHPLAGDSQYGGPQLAGLERQFLHAAGIRLVHPQSGRPLRLRAPLAADLQTIILGLKQERG